MIICFIVLNAKINTILMAKYVQDRIPHITISKIKHEGWLLSKLKIYFEINLLLKHEAHVFTFAFKQCVGLQNGIFAIVKNAFSNCKMLMFLAMSVMGSQPFVT